jgi:hypothetical protein
VDDVLGHTHIETGFNLVRITSLEHRSDHRKGTLFASSVNRILLESVQTFSDGNELIIVGGSAVHGDQER